MEISHYVELYLQYHRIARSAGTNILRARGVVRGYTNWGECLLPRPTTKYQSQYRTGNYFIMRFDSSVAAQQDLQRLLGLDPRMIRWSIVKMAHRLGGKGGGLEKYPGKLPWLGPDAKQSFESF